MKLNAVTAWRMMSKRDPWVNMLRTTVACFAAAVGGADSITIARSMQPVACRTNSAGGWRATSRDPRRGVNLAKVIDPPAVPGT